MQKTKLSDKVVFQTLSCYITDPGIDGRKSETATKFEYM